MRVQLDEITRYAQETKNHGINQNVSYSIPPPHQNLHVQTVWGTSADCKVKSLQLPR